MKYIMFVRQGQLVPIIFPDFMQHREVVNAISHTMSLAHAAPVTAGTCEIYCTSTNGSSESTQLTSRPSDALTINVYDYCHGHAPATATVARAVRDGFMAAMLSEKENWVDVDMAIHAAVDDPRKLPHDYAPTEPYKGCAVCGVGPGAAVHNSAEISRFKGKCTSYCGCMGDDPNCPVHGGEK